MNLHYNGADSYLFVNGTEMIKFQGKDSEITPYELHLENISKDWLIDNIKKVSERFMFMILALIMMLCRFRMY